jgi:hypothetical protein
VSEHLWVAKAEYQVGNLLIAVITVVIVVEATRATGMHNLQAGKTVKQVGQVVVKLAITVDTLIDPMLQPGGPVVVPSANKVGLVGRLVLMTATVTDGAVRMEKRENMRMASMRTMRRI